MSARFTTALMRATHASIPRDIAEPVETESDNPTMNEIRETLLAQALRVNGKGSFISSHGISATVYNKSTAPGLLRSLDVVHGVFMQTAAFLLPAASKANFFYIPASDDPVVNIDRSKAIQEGRVFAGQDEQGTFSLFDSSKHEITVHELSFLSKNAVLNFEAQGVSSGKKHTHANHDTISVKHNISVRESREKESRPLPLGHIVHISHDGTVTPVDPLITLKFVASEILRTKGFNSRSKQEQDALRIASPPLLVDGNPLLWWMATR